MNISFSSWVLLNCIAVTFPWKTAYVHTEPSDLSGAQESLFGFSFHYVSDTLSAIAVCDVEGFDRRCPKQGRTEAVTRGRNTGADRVGNRAASAETLF